jgi:ribosomal protein L37AE/L43A
MQCPECGSVRFGKLSNGTWLCRGHKHSGEPCTYYTEKRDSKAPLAPDKSGEFDLGLFTSDAL